ncbi:YybH family protein [Microbaculum sp. FT89]|uniref:YybH family protein n=1 Tax=Microbaculum sp. FT89 TaxID=3447298 RepID=UPI003F535F7F
MDAVLPEATTEVEIRSLMGDYYDAIRAADCDRIASFYAPDIRAFDAIAELQFEGRDAYKAHWQACMAMCEGMTDMVFEMHDFEISTGSDVAFGHCLVRCGGTDPKGERNTFWMRASFGLERRGGRWLIAHEHNSAPFDPVSTTVMTSLEP